MGALTLTWTHVLVIVVAALGVYLVELLLFLAASRRESARAAAVHERLAAIEAQVASLVERVVATEHELERQRRQPQTSGQYRDAVQLAQSGSDPQSVASACGISLAEAELIVALHRARAP